MGMGIRTWEGQKERQDERGAWEERGAGDRGEGKEGRREGRKGGEGKGQGITSLVINK